MHCPPRRSVVPRLGAGLVIAGMLSLFGPHTAMATPYRGIEFPDGARSFADLGVSYAPKSPVGPPHNRMNSALGVPNCPTEQHNDDYCAASLGPGGVIVVKFVDNVLTGSGASGSADGKNDLHIFEVGLDVEAMTVEISKDGQTWHSLGMIGGSTRGVDIDASGWTRADRFRFVRLTDDPLSGSHNGASAGADIDAVGAISSEPVQSPTALSAEPLVVDIGDGVPAVYIPGVEARLTTSAGLSVGIADKTVQFTSRGGTPLCSAVTGGDGVATCTGEPVPLAQIDSVITGGVVATFVADADYLGSTGAAGLVRLNGSDLPS